VKDVFSFTFNGHVYTCHNESSNMSAAGLARPSNAEWRVTLDGVDVFQFPSAPDDTEESVRRRVTEWDEVGCHATPKPVTAFSEDERFGFWLEWLWYQGRVLFQVLGVPPDARFARKVPRAVFTDTAGWPGDVDLLLCSPDHPDLAMAVEAKPLTVRPEDFADGGVRRLQGLLKGAGQANGLVTMGFNRVYLLLLLTVDASQQRSGNFFAPSNEHFRALASAVNQLVIDPRVGVACAITVQATARSVYGTGACGVWTLRPATPRDQPPELTARVAAYIPRMKSLPPRPLTFFAPMAELLARGAASEPTVRPDNLPADPSA